MATKVSLLLGGLLLCISWTYANRSSMSKEAPSTERDKKLFSVFSVVTFPNNECTAKSDSTMKGTCFSSSECATKGGSVDGNCAAGFGVCCTFMTSTCGGAISKNISYILNPNYPTTYSTAGSCSYTITPISTDICQLRLDFVKFQIAVVATGICTDSFAVNSPSGRDPPTLCGTLTNQHIYVEAGRTTTATTAAFTIVTGGTWKIKVTQIECSSLSKAPSDCYQWLTGSSGNVISYGWYGSQMQQSVEYTYCIRREQGYCGIQYAAATGTTIDSFDVDTTITVLNGYGAIAGATPKGFISIPGSPLLSHFSGAVFADLAVIAGGTMPGAVTSTGHTFMIRQVGLTVDHTGLEGFNLMYSQLPCSLST